MNCRHPFGVSSFVRVMPATTSIARCGTVRSIAVPALIARCTGVADVRAAVRLARAQDLLVAVRGGGHSFPGLSVCDDGMLIDLGPMKGIRVDPEAAHGACAGRRAARRARSRDAGVRARRSRGNRHPHRPGRPDARRWHRLDHAQVRAHHRSVAVRGRGHRRRRVRDGQRGPERRPLLGRSRRRRATSASSPTSSSG